MSKIRCWWISEMILVFISQGKLHWLGRFKWKMHLLQEASPCWWIWIWRRLGLFMRSRLGRFRKLTWSWKMISLIRWPGRGSRRSLCWGPCRLTLGGGSLMILPSWAISSWARRARAPSEMYRMIFLITYFHYQSYIIVSWRAFQVALDHLRFLLICPFLDDG